MSNAPLKIFIGYDHRQPISYNVLQQSIFGKSSKPVSITPIVIEQTPLTRVGLTPFTFSRFLTPWLTDYQGWALFLDIDILLMDDISKLFELANDKYAVMVSKNKVRYEWASVMLFNCGHEANKILTPSYVEHTQDALHGIAWCKPEFIGDLPSEWNHLVGYDKPRPDAKLVHYTQGVPCFMETRDSEYAEDWQNVQMFMNQALPWVSLMGHSKHAVMNEDNQLVPRYKVEPPQ